MTAAAERGAAFDVLPVECRVVRVNMLGIEGSVTP